MMNALMKLQIALSLLTNLRLRGLFDHSDDEA